MNMLLGR